MIMFKISAFQNENTRVTDTQTPLPIELRYGILGCLALKLGQEMREIQAAEDGKGPDRKQPECEQLSSQLGQMEKDTLEKQHGERKSLSWRKLFLCRPSF